MARPRKDGLDYFPCDVHFDDKIKALESLHKNDGLVWIIKFWQNAYSTNHGEVNLKGIFGVIQAENCRITTGKQAEIIRDCLEIGLLTLKNDETYTSNGIQKRLNEIVKDRESERKRKLVVSFPSENEPLMGESKVKESKVKIYNSVFITPIIEEVTTYCKERNNQVDPSKFVNFYESKGWMVGKNKMKDWKAAIRTWENKEIKIDKRVFIKPAPKNETLEKMREWEKQK